MLKGVYTYDIPPAMLARMDGVSLSRISEEPASYEAFPDAGEVSVLIARQGAVNRMLAAFPNVRYLQLLNAGYERVDLNLLRARGILFCNARSVYCSTIAEDVFAKLLLLARRYPEHFMNQASRFWPDDERFVSSVDLYGRTLSILGAGNIGREIAVRARGFGLTVIGYDPYVFEQEGFDRIVSQRDGLEHVLREGDFVVTSLPANAQTENIINAQTLRQMKPGAFLINVARGEVVDEGALAQALNEGWLGGAAIDVAKREPLPEDSPLWTTRNLLITPHTSAYGDGMRMRMCALIERNLKRYLSGAPLENVVAL